MTDDGPFRLGWEEWIALPALGLAAMRVKVDTGARTSALHAHDIEPFGSAAAPMVRFIVHPIPSRPDLAIACSAPIADRRDVTSSNGETELRYVIETEMRVGERAWPIELTLTDRGSMAYRMLLGRQAFPEDVVVVPGESFCQPQLSYEAYRATRLREVGPQRALRIALLSGAPEDPTVLRLVEEGTARGHTVERLDPRRCYVALTGLAPEIHHGGTRLPMFDAVIPLFDRAAAQYGAAIVRQFEAAGAWSPNPGHAITLSHDPFQTCQLLARRKVPMPATGFAACPEDAPALAALTGGAATPLPVGRTGDAPVLIREGTGDATFRCLVLDGKVVASDPAARKRGTKRKASPPGPGIRDRQLAVRAAKTLGLGLAAVEIAPADGTPVVLGIDILPELASGSTSTGKPLAGRLYEIIEKHARPRPLRRRRAKRTA